jgi:hypothetical protein
MLLSQWFPADFFGPGFAGQTMRMNIQWGVGQMKWGESMREGIAMRAILAMLALFLLVVLTALSSGDGPPFPGGESQVAEKRVNDRRGQ